MLFSLLSILLLTTSLEAASQPKNVPSTLTSPQKKLSSTQYAPKEYQISNSSIPTATAMKSEVGKANDIIIHEEHNLLGVIMYIVTRLMEIKSLTLSDLSLEILSRLFAAAMSVIFGPNTTTLWPEFANVAVPFLKLLTS